MKRVSATEAARSFSDVLDSVETNHESFVVVRRGREVATIAPAVPSTGKQLKDLLREFPPDRKWGNELREVRALLIDDAPKWHD